MEKAELKLSQILGGSEGYRPYQGKRTYCHSCAPSSVPFTVYGCNISHDPVFVARRKQHES